MHHEVLTVLVLLFVVILVHSLSARIKVSFPILLVLVGLGTSLVPSLPRVRLAPDLVFLVFLPPLLYEAAWFTSWREFRQLRGAILLQAVGLVFMTAATVAIVTRTLIPGSSWALGFLLGGLIAPPDAVAATSVLHGLRIPRASVAILEGESLVNDATSLIVVRFALVAITTGVFSFQQAATQFVWVSLVGVAVGLVLAIGVFKLHKLLKADAPVGTALTILTPYLMYLVAEQVHASGVLAVVSGGLLLSSKSHYFLDARSRVFANGTWATVTFVLNGVVFILLGLQLPEVLADLHPVSVSKALTIGLAVSGVAIATRLVWTFSAATLPRLLPNRRKADLKAVTLIAWAGMRGVVSLAAALAVPRTLPGGGVFPHRALVVFVTFVVILVTLVAQGLSLPTLVRWLRFKLEDDLHDRRHTLDNHLATHTADSHVPSHEDDHAHRERLAKQRTELLRLRGKGEVSHELAREKEMELDLELARLDGRLDAHSH